MLVKSAFITTILVSVSLLFFPIFVLTLGATTQSQDSPRAPEGDSNVKGPEVYCRLQRELLSVRAENAPLGDVLMAIARKNGFKRLRVLGNISLAQTISIDFQNIALDRGLQRILHGKNHSLVYTKTDMGTGKGGAAQLEEVIIFGQGGTEQTAGFDLSEGRRSLPVETLKDLIQQALEGEEVMTRAKGVIALGESGDPAAIEPLTATLEDEDSYVREHAVEALGEIGGTKVIPPLERALLDFADEMFFGKRGTSLYNQWRHPEGSRPAPWPPG